MIQRTCSGSLYTALEVGPGATQQEIKKAYHRLALRYHPDKTGNTTTEEFKKIQEAQSILSDPKQRRAYDTFGKKGVEALNQSGVFSEYASFGALRALFFILSFFALLILLALELAIVREDYKKTWYWPAVFTPLWIALFPLFVTSLTLLYQGVRRCGLTFVVVGLQLMLGIVAAALFVAGLAGSVSWTVALAPSVALYGMEALCAVRYFIPSQFRQLVGNPDSEESVCTSRYYWRFVLVTLFEKVCVFLFFGFAMYRGEQIPEEDTPLLSFWIVFAPLIVYFGAMTVVSFFVGFFHTHPPSQAAPGFFLRLCRGIFTGFFFGGFLFMTCMMASKCDIEQNGATSGLHPSAAVVFIPLQMVLVILVLVPCCAGCFLDGALSSMGVQEDTAVGGDGEQERWNGKEHGVDTTHVDIPGDAASKSTYREI